MNALAERLLTDPLLALLVQTGGTAVAVLLVALLGLRMLRTHAAATRHAVAFAAFAALAVLPLLTFAAQASPWGVPLLPGAARAVATSTAPAPSSEPQPLAEQPRTNDIARRSTTSTPPIAAAAPIAAPWPLGAIALAAWLVLACVRALFELRAARAIARLRRACAEITTPDLLAATSAIARDLGLRRVPTLLRCSALPCPATLGIARPAIALPQSLATTATPTTRALLRHELAHIALGHPRAAIAPMLARIVLPWLPGLAALQCELGAAQEELADNAALGSGVEPLAYARTLVAFAERAAALPVTSHALFARGASPFAHRITRLTDPELDTMLHPTLRGRALASLLATAAVLAPFAVRVAPAQEPQGKPAAAAHSAAEFLPLGEGTTWTWKVTSTDSDGNRIEDPATAAVWGLVPLGDKATCTQVLRGKLCEYWTADERGIVQYDSAYLPGGGLRGVNARSSTRLLAAPVGAETRWEWDSVLSYQTLGQPEPRDPEDHRVHHVAELVAVDEEVKVAAGTFRCAHVRVVAKNRTWQAPHVRELWFGRGAGLVREIETGWGGRTELELTQFRAGAPAPRDPRAAIEPWLRALPAMQTQPRVEWLAAGEVAFWLHGRFAVVRVANDDVRLVYADERATEFALDDTKFWNERRQEQSEVRWGIGVETGTGVQATLTFAKDSNRVGHLAEIIGALAARSRGCTAPVLVQQMAQGDQLTATLACEDAAGSPRQVVVTLTLADPVITKVAVELREQPAKGQQKELDPRVPPPPGGR